MTTIILTIIGILLAAAAALMTIFYGGNAFEGGNLSAQANTYQNAGTNFIAAYQLAHANGYTPVTIDDLVHPKNPDGTPMDSFLAIQPTLPHVTSIGFTGTHYMLTFGGDTATRVCAKINVNLKLNGTPTSSTTGDYKMGCYAGVDGGGNPQGTFFANA